MPTFFLFGKYSDEAMKGISAERTRQAQAIIEELGGKFKEGYALLGEYDLVLICEMPNMTEAMKASIALGRKTGVMFSTAAAMSVEEFDKMVAGL